ncbi:MAG: cation transporter [Ignisphaera sp.]
MVEKGIVVKLNEAYRIVARVSLISVIGFSIEAIFALLSSSFILYTDVVHWAIDGVLEFTVALSLYLTSKAYRRFSWNIFYIENILVLAIASTIFVFYMHNFISYVNETIANPHTVAVTTTEPLLAIVSSGGMLLTWIALRMLRRGFKKTGMELLKAEYIHALVDIVASLATTLGIVATAFTRSIAVELLTIIFILFFILHSISDLFLDSIKSFLGLGTDPELRYKILSTLNSFEEIVIKRIDLRKVGSFYIVRIECFINPSTTILRAHKLRLKIMETCREISELIYHVDVIFYPYKTAKRTRKQDRAVSKPHSN